MIARRITQCQNHCQTALEHYLNQHPRSPLLTAMQYGCLNGGKRLRPLLVYLTGELFDTTWETLDPVALAIEFIHCYSLIHDDLPAMDNDDLRRGKPTCHKQYGEGMAILAGDALLTEAFALLSQQSKSYSAESILKMCTHLSQAAGLQGMVLGQAMDIAAQGQQLSIETLTEMHAAKTGALIAASVQCGALATQRANANDLENLQNFGALMGLAFQVQDDILDVTGNTQTMGKTAGKDAKQDKCTFVSLMGLKDAQDYAKSLHEKALLSLSPFGQKAAPLAALSQYMIERVH